MLPWNTSRDMSPVFDSLAACRPGTSSSLPSPLAWSSSQPLRCGSRLCERSVHHRRRQHARSDHRRACGAHRHRGAVPPPSPPWWLDARTASDRDRATRLMSGTGSSGAASAGSGLRGDPSATAAANRRTSLLQRPQPPSSESRHKASADGRSERQPHCAGIAQHDHRCRMRASLPRWRAHAVRPCPIRQRSLLHGTGSSSAPRTRSSTTTTTSPTTTAAMQRGSPDCGHLRGCRERTIGAVSHR